MLHYLQQSRALCSWGDSLINFLLSVSLLYFPAQMMWGEGRRDGDKVWHRPGTLVIPSLSRGVTMSPICPYKVKAVWGEGLSVPGVITLLARCVAFTALSACSLHHYRETMPWHSTEIEKKQLSWTFIVVWWLVARGRVGVAISRLPTSQRESRPRCCAALDNSPVLLDFCRKHSLTLPKSARRSWKAWWEVSGGSLATQIHSSGSVTVIVLTVGSQLADSPAFTACLSARVSLLLTSVALWEAVRASMLTEWGQSMTLSVKVCVMRAVWAGGTCWLVQAPTHTGRTRAATIQARTGPGPSQPGTMVIEVRATLYSNYHSQRKTWCFRRYFCVCA